MDTSTPATRRNLKRKKATDDNASAVIVISDDEEAVKDERASTQQRQPPALLTPRQAECLSALAKLGGGIGVTWTDVSLKNSSGASA